MKILVSGGKPGLKVEKRKHMIGEDLTGQRFGLLTVLNGGIKVDMESEIRAASHCRCDCGATLDVINKYLKRGSKNHCGASQCGTRWNLSPEGIQAKKEKALAKARSEGFYPA
jgi:hypothetical protein